MAAAELPAGSLLEIRHKQATGTRICRAGDRLEAVLISPLTIGGKIVAPAGAVVSGRVTAVRKLGLGLRHGAASIQYNFDRLRLPAGEEVAISTRLVEVDTAKERVDKLGAVQGISPAMSAGAGMATYAWKLALFNAYVAAPVWGVKLLFMRSPDPEIYFPAGTEMSLVLTRTAWVPDAALQPAPPPRDAGFLTASLPQQRLQHKTGEFSDLVNLVFVGSRGALDRAFGASGWMAAEPKTARSMFRAYRSLIERRGYAAAPMDRLTLGGEPSVLEFQKSLNSVARRHHIRLWQISETSEGAPVWAGAATEDAKIGYSREHRRLTHIISPGIDEERAKVARDLDFTGCVDQAHLIQRPGPVERLSRLRVSTDGRLGVLWLGDCRSPRVMPVEIKPVQTSSRFQVGLRAFRDDLVRSNLVFLGFHATRLTAATRWVFAKPPVPAPDNDTPFRPVD